MMSKYHQPQRKGLILLVVLGMLSLFSLLSVTYVVFASQSRAASVAMARKDIRESRTKNPVFEEAIRQLIRGSTSTNSAMFGGKDLLGDLYGAIESQRLPTFHVRNRRFNPTSGVREPMQYDVATLQRPMLLGGQVGSRYNPGNFLRIPLEPYVNETVNNYGTAAGLILPPETDALTGRIVTFRTGPLQDQSFRIVRYTGFVPLGSSDFHHCYSIVIDLSEGQLDKLFSKRDLVTGVLVTRTVREWLLEYPALPSYDSWASGVYACYDSVLLNPAAPRLGGGFELHINAVPLNSHGIGVYSDGSSQTHRITSGGLSAVNPMPVALQTRYSNAIATGPLIDPSGGLVPPLPPPFELQMLAGDSDEPYDVADFQNQFMSFTDAGATDSSHVIPSFHRAALINYIVNWKDPLTYTEDDFITTLHRIEMAVDRPLSIRVATPTRPGYTTHPNFSAGVLGTRLDLTVAAPWTTNWPTVGWPTFRNWLNFLTVGPWDVDNNGDGIRDSVWVDIDLPLETSAEGNLLKALVAYYVDDLDGKIDINAVGNLEQTNSVQWYAQPTSPPSATSDMHLAKPRNTFLPQGFGYGPADMSFRHLFGKPGLSWPNPSLGGPPLFGADQAEIAFRNFLRSRYASASESVPLPGTLADEPLSVLNRRNRLATFQHFAGNGLPIGIFGRESLGLDRLGNPFMLNVNTTTTFFTGTTFSQLNESLNDPYESRLVTAPSNDRPFTIAEWERIYRRADNDRSALPARLEELIGESLTTVASHTARKEITPISRNLRVPMLSARSRNPAVPQPTSFFELVNAIRALRDEPTLNVAQFQSLFPLEFQRGLPFDLNRPFGNGYDDDGNGEIDEPNELPAQTAYYVNGSGAIQPTGTLENYLISGPLESTTVGTVPPTFLGAQSRQMYARHLYCLAQLIVPQDYVFPNVNRAYFQSLLNTKLNGGTQQEKDHAARKLREIRGRILAQWAVNVVDFRDSDSAMTRFPFDYDPFQEVTVDSTTGFDIINSTATGIGWNVTPPTIPVPPLPAPPIECGVVWGLEQPELLLTESLAFHDIRVKRRIGPGLPAFDQYRIPEGSLFLELYAPRTTNIGGTAPDVGNSPEFPGVSTSLYRKRSTSDSDVVLDLTKVTPPTAEAPQGFPVWRVYLTGPTDRSGPGPTERSPYERLTKSTPPATIADTTLNDLTHQLPSSNQRYDAASSSMLPVLADQQRDSGLLLDLADRVQPSGLPPATAPAVKGIVDPDTLNSRVILFARAPEPATGLFTPTLLNTPGVQDVSQVFVNRNPVGSERLMLEGNQYLVVAPRITTYLGSRTDASSGDPDNAPNNNRIDLSSTWASLFRADPAPTAPLTKDYVKRASMKNAVTMVAGADLPPSWTGGPTGAVPTVNYIGVNVSEPLPNDADYYERPSARLNADDNTVDTETGARGFGTDPTDGLPYADAYNDYRLTPNPPQKLPFDDGTKGPLQNWDFDKNGTPDTVVGTSTNVVRPGTTLDWSTAYLQRLADPSKPWHQTFNPYLTVDWMPIDLTVFSGESNDSVLDPPTAGSPNAIRLASRQKAGQLLNTQTLAFDTSSATAPRGQTFLSAICDTPAESVASMTVNTFLEFELKGDDGITASPPASPRPSQINGAGAFTTLGFLNSTFVLAQEGIPSVSVVGNPLPPMYVGAPGDPGQTNAQWRPDTIFWANRPFVNSFELATVPLSSPGQLMQEFSGVNPATKQSVYAATYSNEQPETPTPPLTPFRPRDTRMPTAALSYENPALDTAPLGQLKVIASPNDNANHPLPSAAFSQDDKDDYNYNPFSHLLNFFQESPELTLASTVAGPMERHPKNTALSLLLDMMETPSPWNDSTVAVSPNAVLLPSSANPGIQSVVSINNSALLPLSPPYNRISRYVEPGRINLNSITGENVFQSLWWSTLEPTDIDFQPYHTPTRPFPQPLDGDIDHNQNGIADGGQRGQVSQIGVPGGASTAWSLFVRSRRGYDHVPGLGWYQPPITALPTPLTPPLDLNLNALAFNPNYPTHFAGVFKPASEAGAVPVTRNPLPTSPSVEIDKLREHVVSNKGVLDAFGRLNPNYVTLMRPGFDTTVVPARLGIPKPADRPLFSTDPAADPQRHAFTDLFPMSRLVNVVSNRSNVFAVYVTVGLFEFNPTTGIGIEYGSDKGEVERFRAFYVVDRSVPVGYRPGENYNIENTILVRRYLDK